MKVNTKFLLKIGLGLVGTTMSAMYAMDNIYKYGAYNVAKIVSDSLEGADINKAIDDVKSEE